MKIKTWKKPIILIAIILIAAGTWAMFTFGNAAAYFVPPRSGYSFLHKTLNVAENERVVVSDSKMYEAYPTSYDNYYIMAKDNKLYLGPSSSSEYSSSWPNAVVTCNDLNYSFNHFSAVAGIYERYYLEESDNINKKPIEISQLSWNCVDGGRSAYNYNNYYACFSDKITAEVTGNREGLGTVTPESAFFYMYDPAYVPSEEDYPGTYAYFQMYPENLSVNYEMAASAINSTDGSCTLTMTNPEYAKEGLQDSTVSFTAKPESTAKFIKWEYSPTVSNGKTVADTANGTLMPGQKVTLNVEQLMTLKAVFEGEPLPAPTVTPPSAISGLVCNGSPLALVTAGKTSAGTLLYALGTDNKTAPTANWSPEIPVGTNAGSYYIWYKVTGDGTCFDVSPTFGCIATIAPQQNTPVNPDDPIVTPADDWDYSDGYYDDYVVNTWIPDAFSAPKTMDYMMFGFAMVGLLFAVSVITSAAIKIRKKRK